MKIVRLQQQKGGPAFIYIPKKWITSRNILKSDFIKIEEKNGELIINPLFERTMTDES